MKTVFETLYDLAVMIQVDPQCQRLTAHPTDSITLAEQRLQHSILETVMPGENVRTPWEITRIFCRNLVNRAQAPISDSNMVSLLNIVESSNTSDQERVRSLSLVAENKLTTNKSIKVLSALAKITSPTPIPALDHLCYLDWIFNRWAYWQHKTIHQLDANELIKDLKVLYKNKDTKIDGIGFALAANFFADQGLTCFGKPDLHVTPIINLLQLRWGEQEAFEGVIQIAQREADKLIRNSRFEWLHAQGGLMPRHLDRLIYLIGSDNLSLTGLQNKRHAPQRRNLIRQEFIDQGIIKSEYQ